MSNAPTRALPARLCLITDGQGHPGDLISRVTFALAGGIPWVQLREKHRSSRELLEIAHELRVRTTAVGAALSINDRVDIALACGADGVHLGWQSMPVATARSLLGETPFIGVSTHDEAEVRHAVEQGADHLFFGPLHDTPSKRGLVEPHGLDRLSRIASAAGSTPVLAIGGIDAGRAQEAVASGASGAAVISFVMASEDPARAARELLAALDGLNPSGSQGAANP